ncbi:hypothetical protein FZC35_02125 [Candidatus Cytomitobacter indipagum]|uniref:Uncharacterized protein n=1 Tax=Candidatus Cytomitobacter indipagum TaxID=2601575 RepID=A0A5C0UFX1_9PROT|nr:hypothetical protein [Candidatus Cytomitobacter indipagum]QEK38162.1 hypothetical protein FZC35_02125 [Candidatus Cytomitobacter indipagum]
MNRILNTTIILSTFISMNIDAGIVDNALQLPYAQLMQNNANKENVHGEWSVAKLNGNLRLCSNGVALLDDDISFEKMVEILNRRISNREIILEMNNNFFNNQQ